MEVYAWAPKPYHKFMAFKVITLSALKNSISHAQCDLEPGNKSADHLFKTALLEGGQQAKESKLKYMYMSMIPWASLVAQLKESSYSAGDPGSIPGLGKCPGEGLGYPLQYSWAFLMAQMV